MTLGEKLYELRKKHGLSQEQLAECLNVSRQSISKWEGNVTYPESDKLIALSDYFQVSLDYLMKADVVDETVSRVKEPTVSEPTQSDPGPRSAESERTGDEGSSRSDRPRRQSPLLAGVTICVASVIGLVWFGLVSLFLPDSHEQIGASSLITLNGTALMVLFFFGLLIVGVALIIRFLIKK